MSGTITHQFVSALPDDPDTTLVRPSNWNDTHTFNLTGPDVGLPVGGNITGNPNGIAIGLDSVATGLYSIAVGGGSISSSIYSTAIGYYSVATADNSTAIGAYATATGAASVAIGFNAHATFDGSIAVGPNASTSRISEVSFGGPGTERYLANVKDATLGGDAVNLNQLTAASKITGSIEIDFGAYPGSNLATVSVTGQVSLLSGSDITLTVCAIATSNNTITDVQYLAGLLGLSAGNIVAGTSFDIFAASSEKLQGKILINYCY